VVNLLHVSNFFCRPSSRRYSKKEHMYVCTYISVYYATPVYLTNVNKAHISKYPDNSAIRRDDTRNPRPRQADLRSLITELKRLTLLPVKWHILPTNLKMTLWLKEVTFWQATHYLTDWKLKYCAQLRTDIYLSKYCNWNSGERGQWQLTATETTYWNTFIFSPSTRWANWCQRCLAVTCFYSEGNI
jgi:hypothetical protein